jgi:hypothetical protein
MGHGTAEGHRNSSRTETAITDESDLGSDSGGNDALQVDRASEAAEGKRVGVDTR